MSWGGAFYATKLYQDLRESTGLVYFVDSRLDAGKLRSVYSAIFACDPDKVSRASAIVVRDLGQMRKTRVPEDQLEQTKALVLRKISLSESSTDQIAEGFLRRTATDLPLDEPVRAAKKIQKAYRCGYSAGVFKMDTPGRYGPGNKGAGPAVNDFILNFTAISVNNHSIWYNNDYQNYFKIIVFSHIKSQIVIIMSSNAHILMRDFIDRIISLL